MRNEILRFVGHVIGIVTGLYIAKTLGWLPK